MEIQLTLKLHSSTIQTYQAYNYRWPSLLSQIAFCWSCQTIKVYCNRVVKLVNGINKNVCGAKLNSANNCLGLSCGWCLFLRTQHCCLCPNERYNLLLAAHPPLPPTSRTPPSPTTHIPYHPPHPPFFHPPTLLYASLTRQMLVASWDSYRHIA